MKIDKNKYAQIVTDLAENSFRNGEFPAGAVVVIPSKKISNQEMFFISGNSYGYNHAELQAIDAAIRGSKKVFPPLKGAVLFTSMESCMMCMAKAYWAGIREVYYILPKDMVDPKHCYAGDFDFDQLIPKFWEKMIIEKIDGDVDLLLDLYKRWEQRITAN